MLLIKIGGGKKINLDFICEDIALLVQSGQTMIVVHGASAIRDDLAKKLGVPTRTIIAPSGISSVYTDAAARDVFLMAYAGLQNKTIVATLQKYGVNAIGLSGIDGRLWEAKRKDAVYAVEQGKTKIIKDNLTGKVERINAPLLQLLVHHQYVPVLCPPAISHDHEIVNTDNDVATALIAEALSIKKMVVLFEAPGMLRDVSDEKSVIAKIAKKDIDQYMYYAKGRMKKKLLGTTEAFKRGMRAIYWGDGRIKNPIQSALQEKGTVIE